jgi:hypothetical protein
MAHSVKVISMKGCYSQLQRQVNNWMDIGLRRALEYKIFKDNHQEGEMRNLKRISAALALSSLTVFFGLATVASDLKQPMIDSPAQAFVLKSLDGKTVSLQEQRGKFVVLHIAASW